MISVLCVDDEPNFLYLSKTFLEKTGDFTVDTAQSAEEALRMILKREYDAIISDYMMPTTDGLKFLRILRNDGDDTPFILVSCRGQEPEVVEAINDGLSGYLSKEGDPMYSYAMLSHRIKQVVSLRQSENGWKQSEERFRLLFTRLAEGVGLFTLTYDESGKPIDYQFVDVNTRYEEIFNYSRDVVIGKTITEVVGSAPFLDECISVVKSGRPVYFERYLPEQEKHYAIAVSPWLSTGFAMIFSDITRRVEAEEQLRETSQYLQNLITHAGTPIIVWDPDGKVTQFNQAFEDLTGYSKDEILNMPIKNILPVHDSEKLLSTIHLTKVGMSLKSAEIPVQTKCGEIRILRWNSANIKDQNGEIEATIALGVDITRQKELEEENAAAVRQLKKNLAELAILNDGIRNPLAVILACTEFGDAESFSRIPHQIWEIDKMINQLDIRWIESEKILKYLEKHYAIDYRSEVNKNNICATQKTT